MLSKKSIQKTSLRHIWLWHVWMERSEYIETAIVIWPTTLYYKNHRPKETKKLIIILYLLMVGSSMKFANITSFTLCLYHLGSIVFARSYRILSHFFYPCEYKLYVPILKFHGLNLLWHVKNTTLSPYPILKLSCLFKQRIPLVLYCFNSFHL